MRIPGAQEDFAYASSAWLLLDINRMRPVTVNAHLPLKQVLNRPRMVAEPFPPLESIENPDFSTEFRVRRADIDMNDHVNNVHYVEWLAESLPEAVWRNADVSELDVEYKRAVKFGDTVTVQTYATGDGTYIHRMGVAGQNGDVLRARTVWKTL
jgi:medium-chain acyl-[acyl-carrier-protein] hydrolase